MCEEQESPFQIEVLAGTNREDWQVNEASESRRKWGCKYNHVVQGYCCSAFVKELLSVELNDIAAAATSAVLLLTWQGKETSITLMLKVQTINGES